LGNMMMDLEEETLENMEEEELVENENEMINDYVVEENLTQEKYTSNKMQQFMPPRMIEEAEYLNVMRTLNQLQRRIVLDTLYKMKTSSEPFYTFLSGGAGVGKSHAITAIVQSCLRFQAKLPTTNPEEICILVTAPTGKAAFNVFGMTLHCTFKLPPTQYGGKLCNLDDSTLNSLRIKMRKVKLFIVDEISMVSVRQLFDIDQRLQQVFATTDDFGKRSFLVVGDFRQLPPIAAQFIFDTPKHIPLGELAGNHLWHRFKYIKLTEIMRQKGEHGFCKALNNMAEGTMDVEDIKLIKSREVTRTNKPPRKAIWLFRTNADCGDHNKTFHQTLDTEGAPSVAHDKVEGGFLFVLIFYVELHFKFLFFRVRHR
jgi:hypothetical protein